MGVFFYNYDGLWFLDEFMNMICFFLSNVFVCVKVYGLFLELFLILRGMR